MAHNLTLQPEWLDNAKAFPFPDWKKIQAWVGGRFPETEWNEVYIQLARDWMSRVALRFPAKMTVAESANFILVIPEAAQIAKQCLVQLESYEVQICAALAGLALAPSYGKRAVIISPDLESYTRYLGDYYRDGQYMMPGGVCLRRGYTHFIVPDGNLTRAAPVLAHELCHAYVTGIPWPAWVDEAVAQAVEYRVSRINPYLMNRELVRRHQRYWTPELMQKFWTGHAFSFPDEGSELSYHLSRFLLETIAQNGRPAMLQFLRTAQAEDAGFEAFWKAVGVFPSEVLGELLGEKDWTFSGYKT